MDLTSVRFFASRIKIEGTTFQQFLMQRGYIRAQFKQDSRIVFVPPDIAGMAPKLEGRNQYDFAGILRQEGFRAFQTNVYELSGERVILLARLGTREVGLEQEEILRRQGSDEEGTGNYQIHGGAEGANSRRTSIYNP
jgi:hypothetical protein